MEGKALRMGSVRFGTWLVEGLGWEGQEAASGLSVVNG